MKAAIKGKDIIFPASIDADLMDLIKKILIKDPKKRISLADIMVTTKTNFF